MGYWWWRGLGIGGVGCLIMLMVVMSALVMVSFIIRSNIIDFMSGICCVGSVGVLTIGFCGSYLAHHHEQHHH